MQILLIKSPQGFLYPLDEDQAEKLKRIKVGGTVTAEVVEMRNAMFHRKMLSLFRLCYDVFDENCSNGMEYKGQKVKPSFERFRKDLVILAGHYDPVFDIKGNLRLEAHSISYAQSDQEKAEAIFSDCINAALTHVYRNTKNEEWLRNTVEQLISYC